MGTGPFLFILSISVKQKTKHRMDSFIQNIREPAAPTTEPSGGGAQKRVIETALLLTFDK